MTSFGAKIIHEKRFMPTYNVQEQVFHRSGALQPLPDEERQCLQIYFVSDMRQQTEKRVQANKDTNTDIIWNLQEMLHEKNTYVRSFKYSL